MPQVNREPGELASSALFRYAEENRLVWLMHKMLLKAEEDRLEELHERVV